MVKLGKIAKRRVTTLYLMVFALIPLTVFAGGKAEEAAVDDVLGGREAPALSRMVQAGELPPLEERLPSNPKVVVPRDEIGVYGGTARSALLGGADQGWFVRTIAYDGIVTWDEDWTQPTPAAASQIEVSDDATEFTFTLRSGLRWHDGEPFTSADVEWWYEHELGNEELTPAFPANFQTDGEPATLEIIDEITFRFTFSKPHGLFLNQLAGALPWVPTAMHYGKQFHADFNDQIHDVAADAGYDNWVDYYSHMIQNAYFRNPDLPSIRAWTVVEGAGYTGDTTVVRFERNPYYYRVDTEGNQLPYLDGWTFAVLEQGEVLLFQIMSGEIDLMVRHINTVTNKPVLHQNQEAGNYRFVDREPSNMTATRITFNETYDDDVWRQIIQNKDFRIGLSHAMDREEISDIIHAGLTRPRQPAPLPGAPWYNERLAKQYTEYDLQLANEHFDRAGFELDANGRRLGPDGRPIEFTITISSSFQDGIDIMEIVQQQWRRAGIEMNLNVVDHSLRSQRRDANLIQGTIWRPEFGLLDGIPYRTDFVPGGVRWNAWWGGNPAVLAAGVRPEEPPEAVRKAYELVDRIGAVPPAEQIKLMSELMELAADEFWRLGTVSWPPDYGIVHNRIGNFPDTILGAWVYPDPAPIDLSLLFIRE